VAHPIIYEMAVRGLLFERFAVRIDGRRLESCRVPDLYP
jgi:hypothetical protein